MVSTFHTFHTHVQLTEKTPFTSSPTYHPLYQMYEKGLRQHRYPYKKYYQEKYFLLPPH
jgi:hypothetical protein